MTTTLPAPPRQPVHHKRLNALMKEGDTVNATGGVVTVKRRTNFSASYSERTCRLLLSQGARTWTVDL